jgi:phytoene/squalene synthetase
MFDGPWRSNVDRALVPVGRKLNRVGLTAVNNGANVNLTCTAAGANAGNGAPGVCELLRGETDPRNLAYSDGVCSALQLINFLQDVAIDYAKGRIYVPVDELQRFGIAEAQFASGDMAGRWRPFMRFQIERARRILQAGAPLGRVLKGRVGLELRMIVLGGERILKKLHAADGDVFRQRPVLRKLDWAYMFARAVLRR